MKIFTILLALMFLVACTKPAEEVKQQIGKKDTTAQVIQKEEPKVAKDTVKPAQKDSCCVTVPPTKHKHKK